MKNNIMFLFMAELQESHLFFRVYSQETDSIIIVVDVPGQHWKVEFLASGIVKVKIFRCSGEGVCGEEKLPELLQILQIDSDSVLKLRSGVDRVYALINELRRHKKEFFLGMYRTEEFPMMIMVEVQNQFWEVEIYESGEMDVEAFLSDGQIYGEEKLPELIREFAD
jgi:hypothetical protein